jgi:hypothetical protein
MLNAEQAIASTRAVTSIADRATLPCKEGAVQPGEHTITDAHPCFRIVVRVLDTVVTLRWLRAVAGYATWVAG